MPMLLDNAQNPLARFSDGARIAGSDHPLPLLQTVIDIQIRGGLSIVRTARTFVNAEERSIEATITFPVPVHATVVSLDAVIDGRTLVGKARRKQAAREAYEDAIDSGKTAVLHEEALRGIHILSVAHLPPGKDIVVSSTWAMPLSRHEAGAMLRIPVSVGDIFGRSSLSDADDLTHSPASQVATLNVRCDPGISAFWDAAVLNGSARVVLDRPIDLFLPCWRPGTLRGTAADGRAVTLEITPASSHEASLNAALLLDQSGSMAEAAFAREPFGRSATARTKHQLMVDAVSQALASLRRPDKVGLWQFDTRDIDVQALARSGRRFTAVLVGEDSLDAYIGHLAALTGGQLFVVPAAGAERAIIAALESMRSPHFVQPPISGEPIDVSSQIGGMEIRACWSQAREGGSATRLDEARTVGAVAAAMAIPHMTEAAAASFAEAHGIVCHLTSLVMTDEAAEAQDGIPAQRKMPLMTPGLGQSGLVRAPARQSFAHGRSKVVARTAICLPSPMACPPASAPIAGSAPPRTPWAEPDATDRLSMVSQIDWSEPEDLRQGDPSSLPSAAKRLIEWAIRLETIIALARSVRASPVTVVIGLLARVSADTDRNAARLFRAILGSAQPRLLDAATRDLGLEATLNSSSHVSTS